MQALSKLQRIALASAFHFGKVVCGFSDLTADFHLELARFAGSGERRKLLLAPRGHLKSSIVTVAETLRRATLDPESTHLVVGETVALPIKLLDLMQQIVLSPAYRMLFPDRVPDPARVPWNSRQLTLRRRLPSAQATVEVCGVGGADTGNHYDRIVEDDLVGKAAREMPSVMEAAIQQHKLAESLLKSPRDGEVMTVGTRWHREDLAAWILANEPNVAVRVYSWHRPDGSPWWPERFPPEEIERLRVKYGPALFALMYENRAIAEGRTELSTAWLRYYRLGEDARGRQTITIDRPAHEGGEATFPLEATTRFLVVDPAFSSSKDACRSAIVVAAVLPTEPFSVALLEARAERVSPKVLIDRAYELFRAYDCSVAAIEVVAGQVTLAHWIPTVYPDMPIRRLKTDSRKSKETRIREFAPYAEQGRLYVRPDLVDFIEEWESFPSGRTMDILDALAYLPQIWFPPGVTEEVGGYGLPDPTPLDLGADPLTGY